MYVERQAAAATGRIPGFLMKLAAAEAERHRHRHYEGVACAMLMAQLR